MSEKIPLIGFTTKNGMSDQLIRLARKFWGAKIGEAGKESDTAVNPLAQELVPIFESLYQRTEALAVAQNNLVNILNVNNITADPPPPPAGWTGSFQVPRTFTVTVTTCSVSLDITTYWTVSVQQGIIVDVS